MVILCCCPILIKVINNPGKTAYLKNLEFHIKENPNCFKGFVVVYILFPFPRLACYGQFRSSSVSFHFCVFIRGR